MASVRADFVSRGPGVSKFNLNVTFHGRMYHDIGALEPVNGMIPRYASVYMHEMEHATSNRKHFCYGLQEDLLSQYSLMLEEKKNLVKSYLFCGI